jgi:hypothetical protein
LPKGLGVVTNDNKSLWRERVEMNEQEEIDIHLEAVRLRDYPSLTLEEMRDIFNETYERLSIEHTDD